MRGTLSGFNAPLSLPYPGFSLRSNPGLKLVNTFGVSLAIKHFTHRDGDLAWSNVRLACVRSQHVVEHQDVARLPKKTDRRPLIRLRDRVYHLRLDWTSIAVINIPRIISFVEERHHRLPRRRLQKTDVMQLNLIEENHLASLRMHADRIAHLASSQPIIRLPLKLNPRTPAELFNHRTIVSSIEGTPTDINPIRVVAHVHHLALSETLDDRRIEPPVNFTAINNRRLASLLRRLHAVEPDAQRPAMHVRAFVMKQDRLIVRVRRRAVNFPAKTREW